MQDSLLFGPTLQLQHVTLAEIADITHRMPQDYASYQVDQGQVEEAIETLEKGRALLWSEMRHLRTSIDQLLQVDPQLGQKFATINQDLEELTKSIPPSHKLSIDDGLASDLKAVDPFGHFLLKQRKLLKERGDLISQIRALPGFSSFLESPSFFFFFFLNQFIFWNTSLRLGPVCIYEPIQFKRHGDNEVPTQRVSEMETNRGEEKSKRK
jgi:hypothetical protein